MNPVQQTRHMMAQHGVECTIGETKDLMKIAYRLKQLAKIPDNELKVIFDMNNWRHASVYDAVMQIKYGRTA